MNIKLKTIILSVFFILSSCNDTKNDKLESKIEEPFEPSPYHKCPLHKCSNLVRYVRVQNYQNGGLIEERNRSKDLLARCDFGPEGTMNPWLSDLCKSTETKNTKSTDPIKQSLIEEFFVLSFEPDLDTLEIETFPPIPHLRYNIRGRVLDFKQFLTPEIQILITYKKKTIEENQ